MKSFTIHPPSVAKLSKAPLMGVSRMPKVGMVRNKLRMPNPAKAPSLSGTRTAKGFAESAAPGLEPLQPMHTSAHH